MSVLLMPEARRKNDGAPIADKGGGGVAIDFHSGNNNPNRVGRRSKNAAPIATEGGGVARGGGALSTSTRIYAVAIAVVIVVVVVSVFVDTHEWDANVVVASGSGVASEVNVSPTPRPSRVLGEEADIREAEERAAEEDIRAVAGREEGEKATEEGEEATEEGAEGMEEGEEASVPPTTMPSTLSEENEAAQAAATTTATSADRPPATTASCPIDCGEHGACTCAGVGCDEPWCDCGASDWMGHRCESNIKTAWWGCTS